MKDSGTLGSGPWVDLGMGLRDLFFVFRTPGPLRVVLGAGVERHRDLGLPWIVLLWVYLGIGLRDLGMGCGMGLRDLSWGGTFLGQGKWGIGLSMSHIGNLFLCENVGNHLI